MYLILLIFIGCVCVYFWIKDLLDTKQKYESLKEVSENNRKMCKNLYETIVCTKKNRSQHQNNFFYSSEAYLKACLAEIEKLRQKYDKKIEQLKIETTDKINQIQNERCQDKLYRFVQLLVEKEFEDFDNLIVHLECKDRPAHSAAQKVKEAKAKAKEFEIKYKSMKYEYELLFNLFPELENYLEKYDENAEEIQNNKTLDDIKDDYDYTRNWLTKEEYATLNEIERNQLALDRYIKSRSKTKWQIGRDYEMLIGFEYTQKGYDVNYFGIDKKLQDLGRDLIAENENEILIIQCKYWSKEKIIHEKHICQLYGSTIQYKKQTKANKKIIPVFVTTTKLSNTALDFAKFLKVEVIQEKPFKEFPRIKCNIGKNGEKIYHLPFDQKYDATKINKKGESYEYMVEQAVQKGFRRAKKFIPV